MGVKLGLSLETWIKKEDTATLELLKKGKEVTVEGFFKPESYTKDGNNVTVLKNIATKVTPCVREKKQDGPKEEKKKGLNNLTLVGSSLKKGLSFFVCRLSVWTLPGFSVDLILFSCKHAFLNPLMPFFECHTAI